MWFSGEQMNALSDHCARGDTLDGALLSQGFADAFEGVIHAVQSFVMLSLERVIPVDLQKPVGAEGQGGLEAEWIEKEVATESQDGSLMYSAPLECVLMGIAASQISVLTRLCLES